MSEEATPTLAQTLAVEGAGTFVLVFFGCGAAVISGGNLVATGLAFGIAVMVMMYAAGRSSGGHFNPAVSVAAGVSGRLSWREVGQYAGSQLVGALVGGLVLFVLLHGFEAFDAEGNMGQNSFGDTGSGYAWWAAFLLEILLTAVFVYVFLALTDRRNEQPVMAPFAIGLTLAMVYFVSFPATGTSVNPARSIGPGLFAGGDAVLQLWLFILAPLAGAAIAGYGYPLVFGWDRERPVRAPRPVAAPAPQWDPQRQQWVSAAPAQAWQQPQAPQQAWGQPDPNAPQQWTGAPQAWQQQPPQAPPQQAPQQGWGRPDPNAPQPQQWSQPDPDAPRQPWEAEAEDGRTQIRPPEPPA